MNTDRDWTNASIGKLNSDHKISADGKFLEVKFKSPQGEFILSFPAKISPPVIRGKDLDQLVEAETPIGIAKIFYHVYDGMRQKMNSPLGGYDASDLLRQIIQVNTFYKINEDKPTVEFGIYNFVNTEDFKYGTSNDGMRPGDTDSRTTYTAGVCIIIHSSFLDDNTKKKVLEIYGELSKEKIEQAVKASIEGVLKRHKLTAATEFAEKMLAYIMKQVPQFKEVQNPSVLVINSSNKAIIPDVNGAIGIAVVLKSRLPEGVKVSGEYVGVYIGGDEPFRTNSSIISGVSVKLESIKLEGTIMMSISHMALKA